MMSGTPAGSVASIWGTTPSHSTSAERGVNRPPAGRGARSWTAGWSWTVSPCPPEWLRTTRAPARIMSPALRGNADFGGAAGHGVGLPGGWRERPPSGPRMRPAEAGPCLLRTPRGRGVERRAMGRCCGGSVSGSAEGNGKRGGCEARRRSANCRSRPTGTYDRKRGNLVFGGRGAGWRQRHGAGSEEAGR